MCPFVLTTHGEARVSLQPQSWGHQGGSPRTLREGAFSSPSVGTPDRENRRYMEERIVRTHGLLVEKRDCALVIVDVQEKLVPVIAGADTIIQNIIKLVKFARMLTLPIMLTEQQNLGRTVEQIRSETGEIEPISKITFSCFASDEFRNYLQYLKRKTLILTGIESHICVAQTALDAPGECTVQVVSDAVASRDPRNREIALDRMRAAGVTITSTEMFIYEILKKAGTDEFRATLPLVK
jgi:nicotinamidase-related amidase